MTDLNPMLIKLRRAAPLLASMALFGLGGPALLAAEEPGPDEQQKRDKPPVSLVQAVRSLLGLPRTVAVGGSRSEGRSSICLITPLIDSSGDQLVATAVVPQPVIVTAGPLNELTIRSADGKRKVLYRQLASSKQAVQTPLAWPLEPIQPGETFILELRPRGASGGDRARISLKGADQAVMAANRSLINGLGSNAMAWSHALKRAVSANPALAMDLLFNAPSPLLDSSKTQVINQACLGEAQ